MTQAKKQLTKSELRDLDEVAFINDFLFLVDENALHNDIRVKSMLQDLKQLFPQHFPQTNKNPKQ
jgi:hypothetical protein